MPKISDLPTAGALTGSELLPMVQGGITVKSLLNTVSTYVLAQAGGGMTPSGPAGGDLTGTYPNPTIGAGKVTGAKIAAATVANSNLAVMNNNTVKGNVSGGAAVPADLTQAQLTALINAFTAVLSGAVPASGGGTTNFLRADATWAAPTAGAAVATQQVLLSGSGATYTTPASCRQIKIRMYGGGGGGGAATSNNGGTGGTTIFNSINANGGIGGVTSTTTNVAGGLGGSGGTGTANVRLAGAPGQGVLNPGASGPTSVAGGSGGGSGGGTGSTSAGPGIAGKANTGGGGGGGSDGPSNIGSGGGSGEYVELIINSPAATYTYTVGAGGAGGAAGTQAGGNGGSGIIIVDEYY